MREQVTVTSSPAGCSGADGTQTVDSAYGTELGCGPAVAACVTKDTEHLAGFASFTETFTDGSQTVTANWDLVNDPDKDPCHTVPDHCLDVSNDPTVSVSDAGSSGDLGAACGRATFRWRTVTGREGTVKEGEKACVFLIGNAAAKKVLATALAVGVPIRVGVRRHHPAGGDRALHR